MNTTTKTITIAWDDQDPQCVGWAYHIDGGDSGAMDGAAADAIGRMIDNVEAHDDDYRYVRAAVGYQNGDECTLSVGGGCYLDLEPLLTNY